MTTIEIVKGYINRLCAEAGADPRQIYNHENDAWYFSKGESTLEVFLTSYETAEKVVRTFVRCLSAIYPIPVEPVKRQELYFVALEVNARNMGVKIGTMADNGYMYAIAEREIDGMDYREFVILVNDVGYWADQLSDLFKSRFGEPLSNLN
ncbi:MAG: hypothetical protein Q8941_10985 [Bacteroidota bacterium]|nr:hypothetical protein [Bacteroidota bacterium]